MPKENKRVKEKNLKIDNKDRSVNFYTISDDGDYMTVDIEESWRINARFREHDDLKYQQWFNGSDSLKETVSNGFIDFSHKIFVSNLYKVLGDPREKTCLEIGFGGGRLVNAASKYFNMCYGLDILDETSIEKTKKFLQDNECHNHKLLHRNQSDLVQDETIDFIYSFIVFQHFKGWNEVKKYISLFKRVMKKGAIAKIYFKAFPTIVPLTSIPPNTQKILKDAGAWCTKIQGPHGFVYISFDDAEGPNFFVLGENVFTNAKFTGGPMPGIGSFSSLYVKPEFVLEQIKKDFKILEKPTFSTKNPWSETPSSQFYITFIKE